MPIKELSLRQKKKFLNYASGELKLFRLRQIKNQYYDYFLCNMFCTWVEKELNILNIINRAHAMMSYFPELATEIYKTAIRINGSVSEKDIPINYKYEITGRVRLLKRVYLLLR